MGVWEGSFRVTVCKSRLCRILEIMKIHILMNPPESDIIAGGADWDVENGYH